MEKIFLLVSNETIKVTYLITYYHGIVTVVHVSYDVPLYFPGCYRKCVSCVQFETLIPYQDAVET